MNIKELARAPKGAELYCPQCEAFYSADPGYYFLAERNNPGDLHCGECGAPLQLVRRRAVVELAELEPFTIGPARYARGQKAVQVFDSRYGFKGRAARLCDALRGRYTHRERAYIMSPAKADKLRQLYAAGWDANVISLLFYRIGRAESSTFELREIKFPLEGFK